jgi:hypothetical protein
MNTGNKSELTELSLILSKDFETISPDFIINVKDIRNINEFKKVLSDKIKVLLENKFDLLINLLYRIDIEDRKIEELFSKKDKENIPGSLAELIIERQLQKIYYRKIYKEGKI